jgi:hypothetical protein
MSMSNAISIAISMSIAKTNAISIAISKSIVIL